MGSVAFVLSFMAHLSSNRLLSTIQSLLSKRSLSLSSEIFPQCLFPIEIVKSRIQALDSYLMPQFIRTILSPPPIMIPE